jgi:hypothetical protein
VAEDFNYVADSTQTVAPGGTYPSQNLACISCHDPHGRYRRDAAGNIGTPNGLASGVGNSAGASVQLPIFASGSYDNSVAPIAGVSASGVYRLLGGKGYQPKSLAGSFAFTSDPPVAVAPSTYNKTEASTQTVVAYGKGMSEWCANCHTNIHQPSYNSGDENLRHPAGNGAKLTQAIVDNYKAYVSSGRLSGSGTNSYSTLAPFELGVTDYTVLQGLAKAGSTGPVASTTNNVMCLSCHRAHASMFESATRFFRGNEFMTIADASNNAAYASAVDNGAVNRGFTTYEQQVGYYGRPAAFFGPNARNYCNKCHAKD